MFTLEPGLTAANAKKMLEQGLLGIAAGQTEFDLSHVTAVDSAAVAVLLAWQRAARKQAATLVFKNLPVNLQSLIRLYGVGDLLP